MSRYWPKNPKSIDDEDLKLMDLPYKYWECNMGFYPDDHTGANQVKKYIESIYKQWKEGVGLFLFGPNGTGKTASASIVLKVYRKYKQSTLYTRAEDLRRATFDRNMRVNGEPLKEYARNVDVLLIDDLGKEASDSKGYSKYDLENLLRHRMDNLLVTLFTSNFNVQSESEPLKSEYKTSTVKVIDNICHFVPYISEDYRTRSNICPSQISW